MMIVFDGSTDGTDESAQSARAVPASRLAGGGDYEEAVEIIIYDQGPGVPEKDLELIFEAFYRVDAARDRAVGGEGLGLAIAARAVALHGGAIEARNLQAGGLVLTITRRRSGAAHPVTHFRGAGWLERVDGLRDSRSCRRARLRRQASHLRKEASSARGILHYLRAAT